MKIKIPNLKNNFGGEILERGYDYYKEGRVKNIILDKNEVKAIVVGNRNYRVTIDLTKEYFKCTCPCDFNCKHAAAVIYELKNSDKIQTIDNLARELDKKSKNELITILQRILVSEPRFKKLMSNKPEDIRKSINSLDLDYEEDIDKFVDDVDELYKLIIQKGDRLNNLIILFKKCFKIWDDLGGVGPLEDSMFKTLEMISKEAKKLPINQRRLIIQDLMSLTKDFDFFWDSIDYSGLKINNDKW